MKLRVLGAVAALALAATFAAGALAGTSSNPNKLKANLSGAAEVPAGDPNGRGRAFIGLRPRAERVCFWIAFSRIGRPTAGHIHRGRPGVAGPVVVPLFARVRGETSPVRGCARAVERRLIRQIRNRPARFYVNLHNPAYPDGAIRGQLRRR